jgi:Xaa-Pro aminopeptidase
MNTLKRVRLIRLNLEAKKLDALVVTNLPHVRYVSGYSGSNGLCVLTQEKQIFVTDGRYIAQSKEEVKNFKRIIVKNRLIDGILESGILKPKWRVGFESSFVSVEESNNYKKVFPKIKFIPTSSLVENIMRTKDEDEIQLIRDSVALTDLVFEKLLTIIKPGMTELDVAAEIVYLHRKEGAEADAFEPIVASGERGALPHAKPSKKKLCEGELVTIDMGGKLNGYHSDLTRTIALGKIKPEAQKIYDIVHTAQSLALEAVRSGMTTKELDAVARNYIKKNGYGKYFSHSLGHGLGLQIHEAPLVSWRSNEVIQVRNVITIEPGIYKIGIGGVRIEDDVVVRPIGCEILTKAPKSLIKL